MRYVIIGNGPAGVHAAEAIRRRDPAGELVMVCGESGPPYSRIMVPELMAGELPESELFYRGEDFYRRLGITETPGEAVGLDAARWQVMLKDGGALCYDRLLVSPGSSPVVPLFAKDPPRGVFTLWNRSDAIAAAAAMAGAKKAVVVGGGLVGLQAARALTAAGLRVSVIESEPRLMPLQLDETASGLLKAAAERAGVEVRCKTRVRSLASRDGRVSAVETDCGTLEAQLVIVAVGVRPNLDAVAGSGLAVERGILVDEGMRTSLPQVYAAGDVAQAPCCGGGTSLRALWLCAVRQGAVAGANMAGGDERYGGSQAMNAIELFGLPVISMGRLRGEGLTGRTLRSSPGSHRRLFFEGDRLAGYILAGDVRQAGLLAGRIGEPLREGYLGRFKNLDEECMFA